MRSAAELTLGREPDAVPKARRFVGLCLGSEPVGTVQDIQLAVTELVTNALLHGEPPVAVRLIRQDTTIRIEVEDTGRNLPMQPIHDPDAMTGRGLALVGALSTAWGVDAGSRPGKVVWAELDADRAASTIAGPPEIAAEALAASRAERPGSPVHQVRLGGVPTDLLLAAKAHMDNVVRELTLLRGGRSADGTPLPPAMSALVDTVTGQFAEVRTEMKRQALAAARRGDPMTDLELRLPLSYAEAGERYLAALEEADRYARRAHLLTMAPPLSHRTFRRWYVTSLVEQLRAVVDGRRPPPPEPLTAVLAARLDQLEQETEQAAGP